MEKSLILGKTTINGRWEILGFLDFGITGETQEKCRWEWPTVLEFRIIRAKILDEFKGK
jgi:hypothetical protein